MARLIALLGFFLIAATPLPRPQPSPSPREPEASGPKIEQKNDRGKEQKTSASAVPSSINQVQTVQTQSPTPDANANIDKRALDIENKIADFTLLLVIAAFLQVVAAVVQVRASRLALRADRPYLLPEAGELEGFETAKELTRATIIFKNFGRGPAVIERVVARFDHVDRYPKKADFSACVEQPTPVRAVGAGDQFTIEVRPVEGWTPLNLDDIWGEKPKQALICYGCVYYSSAIKRGYKTAFFWYYRPHPPFFLKLAEAIGKPSEHRGAFIPARHFNYHT